MAALPAGREVEIFSMLDSPGTDPLRLGKMDVLITYRPDPLHSFTIRIPKETATEETIWAAVQADWNTRKKIIGAKRVLT